MSKIEGVELLTLDLLLVEEPLAKTWASRRRCAALGTELSVLERDALVERKLWAGRPQGLADVLRLRQDDR